MQGGWLCSCFSDALHRIHRRDAAPGHLYQCAVIVHEVEMEHGYSLLSVGMGSPGGSLRRDIVRLFRLSSTLCGNPRGGEKVEPRTLIVIAVFSALGFAATENVIYAFRIASHATDFARKAAGTGSISRL